MRVQELYKQVAQLGFEDSLESNDRFIFAANRAIYQINSLRPHVAYVDIVHFPLSNLITASSLEPMFCQGSKIYNVESGRAIYFEAMGKGQLQVNTPEAMAPILIADFDSKVNFTPCRFIIPNTDNTLTIEFNEEINYEYPIR